MRIGARRTIIFAGRDIVDLTSRRVVMKAKKLILCALAICCMIVLAGCGERVHYEPEDYVLLMVYKDDFRILQLSDIHLSNKDDRQRQYDFLDLTIKDADADLIVITGDTFTFADKRTAKEFFDFLDSYMINWTMVFGNHDEQCYFSIDWLTDTLNNYDGYCMFSDIQEDDVYGNSNFAINLMDEFEVKEQLIFMDSNRYNFGEYVGYDYIKQDQIDWYEALVKYTTEQNGGKPVPSICFFHIPVPEFKDAWELAEAKSDKVDFEGGELREPVSCPKVNSGFFEKAVELGSTNGIFVGHDHVNNYEVEYKGINLCYGVNSTDRVYGDADMTGGQVIIIHNDGSLDRETIYHTYEEVE